MPTLSELASIQPTPRNPAWGAISDFLRYIDQNALQKQFGYANPVTGAISEAIGIPAASRVAERLSYGQPITNAGKANVPLIPEDTAEAAMFAAPIAGKYAKTAGKMAGEAINNAMVYGEGNLAKITPQPMRIFASVDPKIALKAVQMEKKGLSAKEIWDKLNIFRNPADNQWRKEIGDETAKLKGGNTFEEAVMNRMKELGKDKTAEKMTVGDVFHHPELFENYPQLKDIEVRFHPEKSKSDGTNALPEKGEGWIEIKGSLDKEKAKDVLLHELQHPIQEYENWAVGGSAADFAEQDAAKKAQDILRWRKEVEAKAKDMGMNKYNNSDWFQNAEQSLVNDYHANGIADWLPHETARFEASWPMYAEGTDARAQAEQLMKLYGLNRRTTPYSPSDMYKRLGGEVEARQVQARQNLTPEQRQQYFPAEERSSSNPYGYDVRLGDMLYLNRQGYMDQMK